LLLQVFIQSKKFFQRFTFGQSQKKMNLHKLLLFQPNRFLRWSGNAVKSQLLTRVRTPLVTYEQLPTTTIHITPFTHTHTHTHTKTHTFSLSTIKALCTTWASNEQT
jgi:hypothetical protein